MENTNPLSKLLPLKNKYVITESCAPGQVLSLPMQKFIDTIFLQSFTFQSSPFSCNSLILNSLSVTTIKLLMKRCNPERLVQKGNCETTFTSYFKS